MDPHTIQQTMINLGFTSPPKNIRDIGERCAAIEHTTGISFTRMDIGEPGLQTPRFIIDANIAALNNHGLRSYGSFHGLPRLKEEGSRFFTQFTGVPTQSDYIFPTTGAMQGCYIAMNLIAHRNEKTPRILSLDPGFATNKLQGKSQGIAFHSLDTFGVTSQTLVDRIAHALQQHEYNGIMWSSPSNPTWQIRSERELMGIADLCEEHDLIAIEDHAYFGFDSRRPQLLHPASTKKVSTILRYTNRAIAAMSASKVFSMAGARLGFLVFNEELNKTNDYYGQAVQKLYTQVASIAIDRQEAFATGLSQTTDGNFSLTDHLSPYVSRAQKMKELFLQNGYELLFKEDEYGPIADGFYFTVKHPKYSSGESLLQDMMYCGLTAVPLGLFGGNNSEGLRICVSMVPQGRPMVELGERLELFSQRI